MAAYKTELRSFRAFEILYPVLKNQELQNHDPVRWAAHTRIGNVWEYPPPPGFAFSSRRGILDRGWLRCPRIDTDGFWFSPFRAGFVRRVRSTFAALSRGTCRGCNCCFNELVQLAWVKNFPATWVTDPIRILLETHKRQSNFFTHFGWHNPKALLSFWWPEQIFWRRMLSKIAFKLNFKRNRT